MIRFLLLLAVGSLFAQEPTFHVQTPLVVLPVTVQEKAGQPLDGLTDGDFAVFDNGVERRIHSEPSGAFQSAISLVIVIQRSGISKAALLKISKVGSMVDGYITGEGGEAAIETADDDVKIIQPFTSDSGEIVKAFRQLRTSSSGTSGRIIDGVNEAIRILAARPAERRRLILVISESRDRGSHPHLTDVLTAAQRENVTIYTATYSAYVTPFTTKASELGPLEGGGGLLAIFTEIGRLAKTNIGSALAEYTGGRHVSFATLRSLENDLAAIGKEVHSQYLLTFTPPDEPVAIYHRIEVKIANHSEAIVRTRPGYWTTR